MRRLALILAAFFLALPLAPQALGQQAACQDGVAMVGGTQYACESVDLLSRVTLSQMNSGFANDIWGWTDPQTGEEYALVGLFEGTAFVAVSPPTEPVYLGRLPSSAVGSNGNTWRDIKVHEDHAFIVSEAGGHGMQVFDLTQLRGVASPTTFSAAAVYGGVGSAHNVAINEATGFAYIVGADGNAQSGCGGGLHMVDITEPTTPTFAGCFSQDGYTHDAQCVVYDGPDAEYQGSEICFTSQGNSSPGLDNHIGIVDVTDKQNPAILAQAVYPDPAYAHQGWLTEDHRYFIANDEIDENRYGHNTRTLVFDVTDLDAPEFLDAYFHPTASIDHNLYVKGEFAFQSNYTSGLRIVGLGDGNGPPSLEEVAFFDTYPNNDAVTYNGAWSNYPYFESGIVIVSDQSGGLFVLDPQLGGTTADVEDVAPGAFALGQPYPNPTTGRTHIDLVLGDPQRVDVVVYDVLGRRVADLFHGQLGAGETRSFAFDGSGLPAGLYFIRTTGEAFAETRQVSITR